ncbi:ATP-binding protein [Clostridium sp.]|uniref:ATP-binding protein n=1 Tax=Clostridium sp. TaxID=1506 RepID=UPI003216B1C4
MIKGYQERLLKIYDGIREHELKSLESRKEEIDKVLPEALNIEAEIGKLCIQVSISAFKDIDNRELYLKNLKEKITDLRMKKSELLVSHNYPMDYLTLKYQCEKCRDTGFIINKKCDCYFNKLVKLYYENSDMKEVLKVRGFNNFNLDYFDVHKINNLESPRKNMEKNLSTAMNFIRNFNDSDENLLFYGTAGTGKTYLSQCVAKELLDKGILVVYRTCDDLMKDLKEIKFNNNHTLENLIVNCDLLIIDDLGTEQMTDFTRTEFFNILNKKLIKKKKMLISTNLSLEDLLKNYYDRITSRLLGEFTLSKFYGEDLRIKLNLRKNKS